MEKVLNIMVSAIGTINQTQRVEAAFKCYLYNRRNSIKTKIGNIELGFPKKGKPQGLTNNIVAYMISNGEYTSDLKKNILDQIRKDIIGPFEKDLKLNIPVLILQIENALYLPNRYNCVLKGVCKDIVNIATTPRGVVAITKLNRWELESYLDSLVEMYS